MPFTGPTGEELTTVYIPLIGLPRDCFHIANVRLCSFRDYHNPTDADAMACANAHLSTLLREVQPEIIVPMGAVACSIFDNINLNMHHGILQPGKWGGWSGWIFPTFHPTAGMRTTSYMIPLMSDFKRLGEILADDATIQPRIIPQDHYAGREDYQVIHKSNDLYDYISSLNLPIPHVLGDYPLAEDTESLPDGTPYCMTFSLAPGTGRLIYARETRLLADYTALVNELDPLHIFHNYLHDVIPFEHWGIPIRRFRDTMVMAYNLCLGGGGDDEDTESKAGRGSLSLKVLAYRHLAMTMTSFKDTVYPHSIPHVTQWLRAGRQLVSPSVLNDSCICTHDPGLHERRGKTLRHTGPCLYCDCRKFKKPAKVKPTADDKVLTLLHRKLNHLILKIESGADYHDADPWKLVKGWHDYDRDTLRELIGPIPLASIKHVPEPDLLNYACKDPDATLRMYNFMVGLKPWIYYED
jgi:uracil-DNA glycosylase family 4